MIYEGNIPAFLNSKKKVDSRLGNVPLDPRRSLNAHRYLLRMARCLYLYPAVRRRGLCGTTYQILPGDQIRARFRAILTAGLAVFVFDPYVGVLRCKTLRHGQDDAAVEITGVWIIAHNLGTVRTGL